MFLKGEDLAAEELCIANLQDRSPNNSEGCAGVPDQ
jgi:hypothetical protein